MIVGRGVTGKAIEFADQQFAELDLIRSAGLEQSPLGRDVGRRIIRRSIGGSRLKPERRKGRKGHDKRGGSATRAD